MLGLELRAKCAVMKRKFRMNAMERRTFLCIACIGFFVRSVRADSAIRNCRVTGNPEVEQQEGPGDEKADSRPRSLFIG